MKLFLLIPYIASLINSSPILNQNNQTNSTDFVSVVNNLKQCYQCDFPIEDFTNAIRLFNDNCINQTVDCNNNFCSLLLTNNEYDNKYTFKLGCISKNYCSGIIEENTSNNHINCCDSNLCNNAAFTRKLLNTPEFIINKANTTYIINNTPPANQTISSDAIVGEIADDISFPQNYLGKLCLHHTFFIDNAKYIITLKKNNCNNKNINDKDIPFSISQPINKIIYLDTKQQIVYELLSSNQGIYSVNYAEDKKLLCFINGNYVFIYKVDDNKQLTEVNRIYLQNKPVDISINHQENILAVANKDTVIFYNIVETEQTENVIPIKNTKINGCNIYRVQYAKNRDILLVETLDSNNLDTAVYNVATLNNIEVIGTVPSQDRQTKLRKVSCLTKDLAFFYFPKQPKFVCDINERRKLRSLVGHFVYSSLRYLRKQSYYYNKWIISPTDNFIINNKIAFTCPLHKVNKTSLEDDNYIWNRQFNIKTQYNIYSWQLDKTSYSQYTNIDMFADKNRAICNTIFNDSTSFVNDLTINTTDISWVYDYFFSNNNPVLALITSQNLQFLSKGIKKGSRFNRYLFLKRLDYSNKDKSFKTVLHEQKNIVEHKLFDLMHTGVFNNDSSRLAVFSDNRIQVYVINLDQNKQQSTNNK